jgi:hypothetical protein
MDGGKLFFFQKFGKFIKKYFLEEPKDMAWRPLMVKSKPDTSLVNQLRLGSVVHEDMRTELKCD